MRALSFTRRVCLCRATLVVCAVSLVGQWIKEAKSKLRETLKIHMYHGGSRIKDIKRCVVCACACAVGARRPMHHATEMGVQLLSLDGNVHSALQAGH
jgi:hypothetical protein